MTESTKVVVFHAGYGCETGCCGHVVRMGDDEKFEFDHPYDRDPRKFAEELVRQVFGEEHVADLDWEKCVVTNEC